MNNFRWCTQWKFGIGGPFCFATTSQTSFALDLATKWMTSLQNGLQLTETIAFTLKKSSWHQFPVLFFTVYNQLLGQIKVKDAEIHNEYGLEENLLKCRDVYF